MKPRVRTLRAAVFAMAFVTCSPQVAAREAAGAGAGMASCGRYLADTGQNDVTTGIIYISWVQGFLTGQSMQRRANKQAFPDLPDFEAIKSYIDKFCRDYPLVKVATGASTLYQELLVGPDGTSRR